MDQLKVPIAMILIDNTNNNNLKSLTSVGVHAL